MDLQKELLESSHRKSGRRRLRATATSLVLHGLLVGAILFAGAQHAAHKVDGEKPMNAFLTGGAAPPPPPPPPPPRAKSGGAPKQATPKPVEIPKPMTSSVLTPPVEIPKELPKVDPLPATDVTPDPGPVVEEASGGTEGGDALAGVEGGVEGGVAGGIVGGQLGGVEGGEVGGTLGGVVGGEIGGTGTGTEGAGTGSGEPAPAPAPEPPPPPPPPAPDVPLRVGGNVKAPVVVDRAEPNYTDAARKAKISGTVVVEAIIDKQGNVDHVKVMKGLPAGLSEEAEKAVRRWRFKPGTLNGDPVATIFNLTVTFKLN